MRYGLDMEEKGSEETKGSERASPQATPRQRPLLLIAFWTILGNVILVSSTIVLGLLTAILGWLPPRGVLFDRIARIWSRLWLFSSGVRLDTSYEQPLDAKKSYVFMANHQSWYDIPALLITLPGQTCFMAKKGLFQVPILGWALHAGGFVPVDRKDRSTARETFAQALLQLQRGTSVLLFPEETRSPDGRLLSFKKGGFLLAMRSGFPIVPVGIAGSLEIRPKGGWMVQPGRITVRYGRPLDISGYELSDRADLMAQIHDEIARLSGAPSQ